ncbi:hypothetical protein [Rhizobium sp. L18]|uniref:hypothetical protein n=1 Tax=unclassified Rhizobium TaxID=2613769 RepID=UPI00117B005A|nr:hypothetical protein [Rhizobium sp. L18]
MSSKKIARYVCVPTVFGLFNVVDTTSGLPAEVHATAVLLKREEARRLISWLKTRGALSISDGSGSCPAKSPIAA